MIWNTYVWHEGQCYFVSTIERTYDTFGGTVRGHETIVWEYDWDKLVRGKMIGQAGGVLDHQRICRCLVAEGLIPDENDDRTARFFN
jgi:hypothetical protein